MNTPTKLIIPQERVEKAAPYQPPAVTLGNESATIIQLLARMANDPSFDPDKMQKLLDFKKQLDDMEMQKEAAASRKAYNAAMAAAQSEMGTVVVNSKNSQTHSMYASYDQIDRAIRPIYTKHGFAMSFDETESPKQEHIRVVCHVSHRDGHTQSYHTDMPADGKGAKGGDVMTKTHAAGAAKSYGMRYLVRGIWNIATGEDDSDGNDPAPKITEKQVVDLDALITDVKADKEKFLRYLKVSALSDILASNYSTAVKLLEAKRK